MCWGSCNLRLLLGNPVKFSQCVLFPKTFIDHLLCAEHCNLSWKYGRGPHKFGPCLQGIFLSSESLHAFKIQYYDLFLEEALNSFRSKVGIKKLNKVQQPNILDRGVAC